MLVALPDLHRAMQGNPAPEQVLQWMVDVSGLPVSLIATLYRMGPVAALPEAKEEAAVTPAMRTDIDAAGSVPVERSTGR
jgi:hypothetical protein